MAEFLQECHRSAAKRFAEAPGRPGMHTVEYLIPPRFGELRSTGVILAHIEDRLYRHWQTWTRQHSRRPEAHLEKQLQLALEDVAMQDMHGMLALTEEQREAYILDLKQLVAEALDRTTFGRIGVDPEIHWEGTLVQRLDPPMAVLVISIGVPEGERLPRNF